jgi:hypothetical protein
MLWLLVDNSCQWWLKRGIHALETVIVTNHILAFNTTVQVHPTVVNETTLQLHKLGLGSHQLLPPRRLRDSCAG